MSKIRILPEQIANQIAAGEVVERPASVVKELVENSIDAGSRRIEIEIEGSGTRLIRIIDDGEGMSEDDLLLSLERHGTSKIRNEGDLGLISTLGFRGEAIPSIGSVSTMTISSRPQSSQIGFMVMLKFGSLIKAHETGCRPGTVVEIRNLFGNTPARKKFLRTVRTEQSHIEEVIKNYGLACSHITFILRVDGRDTLHLDNSLSEERRLAFIMRYDGDFLPVTGADKSSSGKRSVRGFLTPPEQVNPGPARLRVFVNNRVIRDRMINHAVIEGMRGFLLKGRNPAGLLHLRLPADEVDVNVHPAKHEVRFKNSREIHLLISQAVRQTMLDYQTTIKHAIFGTEYAEQTPVPMDQAHPSSVLQTKEDFPFTEMSFGEETVPFEHNGKFAVNTQLKANSDSAPVVPHKTRQTLPQPTTIKKETSVQSLLNTAEPIARPVEDSEPQTEQNLSKAEHGLRVIGQFDDLYIFCKSSQGLVVIDQHAAHERLLYEKLRRQYLEGRITRQNLLFPETVELSIFQSQLVEKNSDELAKMGFTFREFGGNTYIISAVPAIAGKMNPSDLFIDVLEKFGSERSGNNAGGSLDTILATMACKAAVKAGTELSRREIDNLLTEMARADLFSHCPHGRPVVKQFTQEEIKKWFYRT